MVGCSSSAAGVAVAGGSGVGVAGSLVAVAAGGTGVSVAAWLVSPSGVDVLVGVVVGPSSDLLQAAKDNKVSRMIPISKRRCKVIVKPLEKMGLNSIQYPPQLRSNPGLPQKGNSAKEAVQLQERKRVNLTAPDALAHCFHNSTCQGKPSYCK